MSQTSAIQPLIGGSSLSKILRLVEHLKVGLRAKDAEWQGVLDLIPIGACMATDRHCHEVRGNTALARLLEVPPDTNLTVTARQPGEQLPWRVCRDGRELVGLELPVQRSAALGIEIHDEPCDVVFDDGRTLHLLVSAMPWLDHNGQPLGCLATLVDVTEQTRLAAEREQEIRAMSCCQDEFLATFGHELRNPLFAILSSVEVLRMLESEEPITGSMCEIIRRQALEMNHLVEDVLNVSRVNRGKVSLRTEPLDLAALVRQVVHDHQPDLESSEFVIRVDLPPGPVLVDGDRTRLSQVLANLLSNACKFRGQDDPVRVAVRPDRDRGMVCVSVRDTGIGMSPATLAMIFRPFVQEHQGQANGREGLGLGLALVKGLVELHGGKVWATSPGPGLGSEFSFELPLLDEPSAPSAHAGHQVREVTVPHLP